MDIVYVTNPEVNSGTAINVLGGKISLAWDIFANAQDTPSKSLTDSYNDRLGRGVYTGFKNPTINVSGFFELKTGAIVQNYDTYTGDGVEVEGEIVGTVDFTTTSDVYEMIYVLVDGVRSAFTRVGNVVTLPTPPLLGVPIIIRYYEESSIFHVSGSTATMDYQYLQEMGLRSDQTFIIKSDLFKTTSNSTGEKNVMLMNVTMNNDTSNIVEYSMSFVEVRI